MTLNLQKSDLISGKVQTFSVLPVPFFQLKCLLLVIISDILLFRIKLITDILRFHSSESDMKRLRHKQKPQNIHNNVANTIYV